MSYELKSYGDDDKVRQHRKGIVHYDKAREYAEEELNAGAARVVLSDGGGTVIDVLKARWVPADPKQKKVASLLRALATPKGGGTPDA